MAYKYRLIYPDGTIEISDDSYSAWSDAEDAALYDCSCFEEGAEILALSGRNFDSGTLEYEIYEE